MRKTRSSAVRATEARKRAAGLHPYQIWAPAAVDGGGDPAVRSELKRCADRLARKRKRERAEQPVDG